MIRHSIVAALLGFGLPLLPVEPPPGSPGLFVAPSNDEIDVGSSKNTAPGDAAGASQPDPNVEFQRNNE